MNATDTESTDPTTSPADERQPADQAPQDQPSADQPPADQGDTGQRYDQQRYDYRQHGSQPLYRPYEGRMLAGVAASMAQYLGVDPTIVRIVLAVLTVVGGAGIPLYVAGWLLIPDEDSPQSLASEFIGSFQGRSR